MTNPHFGRISEVWMHLVLAEVLATERPEAFLDTHAGDALYPVVEDPERSYGVLGFNDNTVQLDALDEWDGWAGGLWPVGVVVSFDVPSGHLALDHAWVGSEPAEWVESSAQQDDGARPAVVSALRGENRALVTASGG